jgi:hypothetical protein
MPTNLHRYYGAGYSHFITTSCYQRRPLLGTPRSRDLGTHIAWQPATSHYAIPRSRSGNKKNFFDDLSNSIRPFDYVVKAGQPARQKGFPGVIRYAKNLQIACRFPPTPFD